jgi:hypothetical protein
MGTFRKPFCITSPKGEVAYCENEDSLPRMAARPFPVGPAVELIFRYRLRAKCQSRLE